MQAVAHNHVRWLVDAATSTGGAVHEQDGVTWVYAPWKQQAEILFPSLDRASASEILDGVIRSCRRLSLRRLACWSLSPTRPRELGAILVARGFGWGWRPRWMWLDLSRARLDHDRPKGLTVDLVGNDAVWDFEDLPFYSRTEAEGWRVLNDADPRHAWQFVGRLNGEVVAQTKLVVTRGRLGIAGIYNVGVRRTFRGQGIAKAVIGAALVLAKEMGVGHAMLNGTGERVYRQLGFELVGYGQTWACKEALAKRMPSQEQIAYVEAIGRDDVDTLERMAARMTRRALNRPLAEGMTPMKLAVEMESKKTMGWLTEALA